ncbi:uncharacterized protein RCC_05986 [Ramularia collo-cygni]|uniref:Uncharacterized protein n=1 Tax=Ramularia collo-cygni TaxID=112498 RepID=A0A2D3VEG0_9PEZI|nr:uncharacterized protein RCC_05986 [Ramularia collo-cygni]CZT20129.1 uncharacterized protein RCC_05986 [Ramularia collo-cygni]
MHPPSDTGLCHACMLEEQIHGMAALVWATSFMLAFHIGSRQDMRAVTAAVFGGMQPNGRLLRACFGGNRSCEGRRVGALKRAFLKPVGMSTWVRIAWLQPSGGLWSLVADHLSRLNDRVAVLKRESDGTEIVRHPRRPKKPL